MALPVPPHHLKFYRILRSSALLFLPLGLLLCIFFPGLGCGTDDRGSATTTVAGDSREPPFHILLITLDALRADHLGCYGYPRPTSPAMDSLAAEGTLFSQAQVPRGQTWPALTSLLTGRYPLEHGVRENSSLFVGDLELLPTVLQASGYRTAAFLANFGDAIYSREAFGFDHMARADVSSATPHDQWDSSMTDMAVHWITENRERPTFTWVHLMNPHRPYDPPAAERELFVRDDVYDGWLDDKVSLSDMNGGIRDGRIPLTEDQFDEFVHASYWKPWRAGTYLDLMQKQDWHLTFDQLLDLITLQQVDLSASDLDYIHSRYDAEIRTADRCVGRLLETVGRLGLSGNTLVILGSDHGDELYDRNHYFFHSSSIYQGVLRVPLIMRWPGHIPRAVTVDSLAEITDLLPTILDAAGLPQPAELPGRSLLPLVGAETEAPGDLAFAEIVHGLPEGQMAVPPMDGAYSVRDASWKLVLNPSGLHPRKTPYPCLPDRSFAISRQELYNLEHDPGEKLNLLALDGTRLEKAALAAVQGDELDAAEYLLEASRAVDRLSRRLTGWLRRHEGMAGAIQAHRASEEVRQRLISLGYVEAEPLPPTPPETAEEAAGRETLLRTALRICRSMADSGETATGGSRERAAEMACRAEAGLAEVQSDQGTAQ